MAAQLKEAAKEMTERSTKLDVADLMMGGIDTLEFKTCVQMLAPRGPNLADKDLLVKKMEERAVRAMREMRTVPHSILHKFAFLLYANQTATVVNIRCMFVRQQCECVPEDGVVPMIVFNVFNLPGDHDKKEAMGIKSWIMARVIQIRRNSGDIHYLPLNGAFFPAHRHEMPMLTKANVAIKCVGGVQRMHLEISCPFVPSWRYVTVRISQLAAACGFPSLAAEGWKLTGATIVTDLPGRFFPPNPEQNHPRVPRQTHQLKVTDLENSLNRALVVLASYIHVSQIRPMMKHLKFRADGHSGSPPVQWYPQLVEASKEEETE